MPLLHTRTISGFTVEIYSDFASRNTVPPITDTNTLRYVHNSPEFGVDCRGYCDTCLLEVDSLPFTSKRSCGLNLQDLLTRHIYRRLP